MVFPKTASNKKRLYKCATGSNDCGNEVMY